MGAGSSYPAGWYQGPNDPPGVQRYFDGTTWTEHTSGADAPPSTGSGTTAIPTGAAATYAPPPGAPQAPPPGVTVGGPPSSGSGSTTIVIGAIAAVVVLILLIGGFVFLRGRGGTNLEPSQAIDALPSAKQMGDASGLSLGNTTRETRTQSQVFQGDATGGCDFGSLSSDGFKSAARTTGKGGDAEVEATIVVYDTGDNAGKGYRDFQRVLQRLKACGEDSGANQDSDVTTGDAGGGTFLLANSKKGKSGAGFASAPTGNAVVLVSITDVNAKVSQDQVVKLLQTAVDAAKTPDPSRR